MSTVSGANRRGFLKDATLPGGAAMAPGSASGDSVLGAEACIDGLKKLRA